MLLLRTANLRTWERGMLRSCEEGTGGLGKGHQQQQQQQTQTQSAPRGVWWRLLLLLLLLPCCGYC